MFSKLKNTTSDTTNLESREMIVIIDLLLAQPELHIQVLANSFPFTYQFRCQSTSESIKWL